MSRRGRLVIGLMSGTSHDGADAALVSFPSSDPRKATPTLAGHAHIPYTSRMRAAVSAVISGRGGADAVCALSFEIARVFADAAERCAHSCGVKLAEVAAIGSHGQTVWHIPPGTKRAGSTLQICNPSVLAALTGCVVVSDFRAADMAQGGHGAPLVPLADYIVFRRPGETRALHNLGGISNLTVVTPREDHVTAFDTGPGNCLMDDAMRALFGKPHDAGGRTARKGRVVKPALKRLMAHPYFKAAPPKSTGRETFGPQMIGFMLNGRHKAEDVVATLAHFTADSIALAYREHVFAAHEIAEVVAAGGGTRNSYLMELIRERLAPIPVRTTEDYGIPSGAREAMAFAILANETLEGRPGNLPRATGARRAVTLGSITLPPR